MLLWNFISAFSVSVKVSGTISSTSDVNVKVSVMFALTIKVYVTIDVTYAGGNLCILSKSWLYSERGPYVKI